MEEKNKLIVFEDKKIRRLWYNKEWFYSVVDVCRVLVESSNPRNYWNMLKTRELENGIELSTNCVQLKLESVDGKKYKTDCADTKGIFRIIQSIPSKKAEPFKMWLAQVGQERIEEIENPELAQERMKEIYEKKGYPKSWIDKRLRGIAIRQDLTDEWKERGVGTQKEFSILTAEISKATFGMTPNEYKNFKNISSKSKSNLRDNMTDLELIFTMLGEKVTTDISKAEKPNNFSKNKKIAKRGGGVAGRARKDAEREIGKKVMSSKNAKDFLLDETKKLK